MTEKSCSQESAVARAVRTDEWDEGLRAHLRHCATCRGVQDAARWMQALTAQPQEVAESRTDLPDPQILWLRAQLGERQAAAERAQQILQWVEVGCITAVCMALGIWLVWSWDQIGGQVVGGLSWALFDAWPALWTNLAAYGPANAPILFSSVLATLSLLAIAVAYPLLGRE